MQQMVSAKSKWRAVDLAYTALFAVLMMVCAWITVPLTVPFTLQTFGGRSVPPSCTSTALSAIARLSDRRSLLRRF